MMRKWIGFISIIVLIPVIALLQQGILQEWAHANEYKEQLNEALVLEEQPVELPVIMKDRRGNVFAEQYIEWREPVTLEEVPKFVQEIFIQSEDQQFYDHRGYDIAAIFRAIAANSGGDRQQGASTITQQLVRMRFLTTDKTYERKIKEILYAAEVEKHYEKNEILEMYLNEMYFSNQVYGIGGAATYYFNKPLEKLSEAEVTFIAAIPNNPSLYDPVKNFDQTKKRQERLLDVLAKNEVISIEQAEAWKKEPIQLSIKPKKDIAPAYSAYVLAELEELVAKRHGLTAALDKNAPSSERERAQLALQQKMKDLTTNGLVIETGLDTVKQKRDDAKLQQIIQPSPLEAGAAVIQNETNEIVSIFGGVNYEKAGFNRAYQAVRQPGSAFKPLLVYGPLLESGHYTLNTPVDSRDVCIGNYCPKNIHGAQYDTTTLSHAFRFSHNTTAVRMLKRVTIPKAFEYVDQLNFKHLTEADRNYVSALGGLQYGVTPLEMAGAFSSFHNGTFIEPQAIRVVRALDGKELYVRKRNPQQVWSAQTSQTMKALLQDVVVNGTAKGVRQTTSFTGAKTGTTDRYKDIWIAGLNDEYSTALWVGYDNGKSAQFVSESKLHLRAFSELLQPAH